MSDQNFRVEPGLEVGAGSTILLTDSNGNIGIGSTFPTSKLTLNGDLLVSGIITSSSFVGSLIGDVDANIGSIDNISGVAATYTNSNFINLSSSVGNITNLSGTNSNFSGVSTSQNLIVQDQFNVYASEATFHSDVNILGNLSIGGTSFAVSASELQVADKNIILGFSTTIFPSDNSSNHGGIAIASTEGTPLVNLTTVGVNTFPTTYKQILWVKSNTMGAGTTDAFLFNYGVGIGSTLVPTGTVLAAGPVQINSQGNIRVTSSVVGSAVTINSTGANVTGVVTATSFVGSGANLTGVEPFPSGTLMLFQQTAAPTGWTKQTTHNNKALRVVSGAAGSGGSTAFTSVFTSRTPAGTVSGTNSGGSNANTTVTGSVSGTNSGGAVANHTLTTAQIPSHNHTIDLANSGDGEDNGVLSVTNGTSGRTNSEFVNNTGGGGAHNHSFTNPSWSGSLSMNAHTHTFTNPSWSGSFAGTAMDFEVQYVDLIIASKN